MSDRIALLSTGRVEQVGEPAAVYAEPATAYVAGFLGTANLLDVKVQSVADGTAHCRLGELDLRAHAPGRSGAAAAADGQVVIRPERVHLSPAGDRNAGVGSRRQPLGRAPSPHLVFQGPATQAIVRVADTEMIALIPHAQGAVPGWLCEGAAVEVVIEVAGARLLAGDVSTSEVPTSESTLR